LLTARNILNSMFSCNLENGFFAHERISVALTEAEKVLYATLHAENLTAGDPDNVEDRISNAVISLQGKLNKKRIADLNRLIRIAEKEKDQPKLFSLLEQKKAFVCSLKANREEKFEQRTNHNHC